MVGFFRRRFGRLPRLLASYPPYLTPHPGDARLLCLAQCRENLQYLLDVREQRLQLAAELLGHLGIDLRAGLEAEDPREFLAALDQWARAEWPTADRPSLAGTPLEWVALPDRLWRHSMTADRMRSLPLYDRRRRESFGYTVAASLPVGPAVEIRSVRGWGIGMFGFLRRRADGAGRRESRLPGLLAGYPPYLTPFPGEPGSLTLQQCQENLGYLLDVRQRRLEIAADLLEQFGIDLAAGLSAEDPRGFLKSLDQWARREWPTAYTPTFSDRFKVCLARRKEGEHIVLAMLMDIAVVLGETVTRQRPEYSWRLDLDPKNHDSISYQRVVMAKDQIDPDWEETLLDFEYQCIGSFAKFGRDVPGSHPLGYAAQVAIEGGYDSVELPPIDAETPQAPSLAGPVVYDKAKYQSHILADEEGFAEDTADEQAAVPGALFFGWVVSRGLLNPTWAQGFRLRRDIASFKAGRMTAVDLWTEYTDQCLIDYMLSDDANAFTREYYNSDKNGYYDDLAVLAQGLPSSSYLPYTFDNQARIDAVLDQRYEQWSTRRSR